MVNLFIILLSFAGYWRVLIFTFWKDDWHILWESLYSVKSFYDWLHPAIFVEFMAFAPIFGTRPFLWQLTGIILHVLVAVGVVRFTKELTGSKSASVIAGLAYAATFGGLDAVAWASAHRSLWATLFMVTGMYFVLRSNITLSLLYIGLSLFSDPYQTFPLLILLPFLVRKKQVPRLIRILVVAGLLSVIIAYFTVGKFVYGSQLYLHLSKNMSFSYVFSHVYLLGNYFSSIANLMLGWAVPIYEFASTGAYSRQLALIGFFVFLFMIGIAIFFWKTKLKVSKLLLFSLLWMFLSYIPDWLFEPRLTMGGTHRYFALTNVGFILLISTLLSRVHPSRLLIFLTLLFIGGNIITSNRILREWALYRSATTVDTFWNEIDSDVPGNINRIVFVYQGADPIRTYALDLSGAYPFAIRRKLTDKSVIPLVTADREYIDTLLCQNSVPINHVFSWKVGNDGKIENVSLALRLQLLMSALNHDCVPIIERAALEGSI